MKKLLPLTALLFLLGIINSTAQITVTQADVAVIGDTIKIARDTTPIGISVGGTGLQTWVFTKLQVDILDVNAFLDPDSTFVGSQYPNSNLAIDMNSGAQLSYATVDSSAMNIDGFYGDPFGAGVPVAIHFDSPDTRIKFPATYLSAFQDTMHFTYTFSDPQLVQFGLDSIRIVHYTYSDKIINAYGMLTTPADSFDCLRQFVTDRNVDSVFMHPIGGSWTLVPASLLPPSTGFTNNPNVDTMYTYNWYADSAGMPVATVTTDSMGTPISASFKITNKVVAGLFSVVNTSCNGACDGSTTVTAISGYAPYTYAWDTTAASQTTAMADSLCAGNYSVTITDQVGNMAYASVTITEPTAVYDSTHAIDAQCSTCTNGTAYAAGKGGTQPYTYHWAGGQSSQSIANLTAGTYYVTVTDANNCTYTDSVLVGFWPTGVNEVSSVSKLQIYPNPSSGKIFISGGTDEVKKISVFNLLGEMMLQERNSSSVASVDLSNLDSGIYFVKIETTGSTLTKKINMVK